MPNLKRKVIRSSVRQQRHTANAWLAHASPYLKFLELVFESAQRAGVITPERITELQQAYGAARESDEALLEFAQPQVPEVLDALSLLHARLMISLAEHLEAKSANAE